MLRLVDRDMADAAVANLSAERQFLIAYEAALTLSTIPLHCGGYKTHGAGHHRITFRIFPHFMGEEYNELAIYFESCRTKRNVGTYDRGGQISETEASELLEEVKGFKSRVEKWLRDNYPRLL